MPDYSQAEKSKGTLYNEGEKRKSDKAPHFRGFLKVTREQAKQIAAQFKADATRSEYDIRVACWKNQGDNGVYLSLASETMPPDGAPAAAAPPPPQPKPQEGFDDFEDDIPF